MKVILPFVGLFGLGLSKAPSTYFFSFGDSYTTTGFNVNGAQPAPGDPMGNPPLGTAQSSSQPGTFAGGINYVGFLTTKYNTSFVESFDFAAAGACTNDTSQGCNANIPDYNQQVANMFSKYATHKAWNSQNAIFSIFFGINDIGLPVLGGHIPPDANTFAANLVNAYFNITDRIYSQGGRRFMFVGVPPVDQSPLVQSYGQNVVNAYSNLVNTFNGQLAQRINSWTSSRAGAVSATYDYHRWMLGVLQQPKTYGFPDSSCIDGGGQKCIWWNNYHVGSKFNDYLAQRMVPAMESLGYNGHKVTGGYFY